MRWAFDRGIPGREGPVVRRRAVPLAKLCQYKMNEACTNLEKLPDSGCKFL